MTRLVLCVLLAALTLPATAQTTFGLKLGVQAADVSVDDGRDDNGDDNVEFEGRLGFLGGVTADIALTSGLAVRPELLYTQKGFRNLFGGDDADIDGDVSFRLDYLEVPLLIAYTGRTASAFEFSVEAGPTFAYRLAVDASCTGNGDLCEGFDSDEVSEEFDDILEEIDLGLALGATVGSGPFGAGVRYTRGFSNVYDSEVVDNGFEVTNSTFAATLRYRFGAR